MKLQATGKKRKAAADSRHVKGSHRARGLKIAVVVSDFNSRLTHRLLDAAERTFLKQGAAKKDLRIFHVPGAFEIPVVVRRLVKKKEWDAVLTLAVVIRGDTRHFEQVVKETARSLRDLSDQSERPVILGIVPALSVSQAEERVDPKKMNKGKEWALAAIEMANLMRKRLLKKP